MREAALAYAKRGWAVFPVRPKGKKPLVSEWPEVATTNENIINRWWDQWPDANIGVPTGRAMGCWVLDVDGDRGSKSLVEAQNELGALPDTLEAQSGSGGRHLFFSWPAGTEIRNRQNWRPGLDVRGEGGYIVAPPSIHPTGKKYNWPYDSDAAPELAPAEWVGEIGPRKRKDPWERVAPPPKKAPPVGDLGLLNRRAAAYLATCDPAVQGSGGHSDLLWAARAMVIGLELDDATALRLLWDHYNPMCKPPWDPSDEADRKDFERKVTEARTQPFDKPSGWLLTELGLRDAAEEIRALAAGSESAQSLLAGVAKRAAGNESVMPMGSEDDMPALPEASDRKAFPVEYFPPRMEDFCRAVANSHGVDLSFAALPMLCVAGAAMGNAWRLRLKNRFEVPPILWVGLVSPTGTNKSGPLRDIVSPLRDVPEPSEAPGMNNPQGRMVVSDATLEAVVQRMQESKRGLLVFRDELAGWVKGFNAYRKGGGGDEQAWLEFWGAGHYTVDRKTNDEHISVRHAACSILGGIQPKVLVECFDPGRFASGLVPRILIACPPETDSFWTEAEVDDTAIDDWAAAVKWLRTRPFVAFLPKDGSYEPRVISLSMKAKAAYVGYFNQLSLERAQIADENAKGIISKARIQCGRLALVHHGLKIATARDDEAPLNADVQLDSMEAAIAWTRWCLNEQIRVYGFGAHKHKEEQCEYLYGLIQDKCKGGVATPRLVTRLNNRRYKHRTAAAAALEQLVELGFATWTNRERFEVTIIPGRLA